MPQVELGIHEDNRARIHSITEILNEVKQSSPSSFVYPITILSVVLTKFTADRGQLQSSFTSHNIEE